GDKFACVSAKEIDIAGTPANFDAHVLTVGPAQLLQPLHERNEPRLSFRVVRSRIHEHPDAPHTLLRARCAWPHNRRAAEQGDEIATPHSITSSARASMIGAISRPIALGVLTLSTSVNLVGRSIGNSAALAPLRMRSTYIGARRYMSGRLGP